MSHTEKTVVDSGYFDPHDGFTARPIIGSQGLPESGYDGGAPFYQVVPSGEWWGDDYEWNWGPSSEHGGNLTGGSVEITKTPVLELLGLPITVSGADLEGVLLDDYDELIVHHASITGIDEGSNLVFFQSPPVSLLGSNSFRIPVWKYLLGERKESNPDVETKGYVAEFGLNYVFPIEGASDLTEDWQASTRFQDIRWYEQSGLIPTYPSNHPDESRDPLRSPSPKERVYAHQGSRDAAGAANKLETGSPQSSVDGSSDQAFSNAADSTNTKYVLGMEDAFMHYYEDTYQYVYMPGGRTGPTRTLVNKFEALDFNKRFHNRNNGGEITDKADKIFGVQIAQDSLYAKIGYRKVETEEPEIDPEGDYTPTGKIRESE